VPVIRAGRVARLCGWPCAACGSSLLAHIAKTAMNLSRPVGMRHPRALAFEARSVYIRHLNIAVIARRPRAPIQVRGVRTRDGK
jgi:hypothetical protein